MSVRTKRWSWAGFLPFLALTIALGVSTTVTAQPAGPFPDFLTAGEFGPAREFIDGIDDPLVRDAGLRDLAAAMAGAGARGASVDTASYIGDDRLRARAFSEIGALPIGRGGGPQADFDSLIELITTTIAPTTWDEVGGPGSVSGFETGVRVDPVGLLSKLAIKEGDVSLAWLRSKSATPSEDSDVRKTSRLRKVSLNRLEAAVQKQAALGKDPKEVMQLLAGIYEVKYLFVYPESGDIVIAGPASDWVVNVEGRQVSTETGKPILHLDDLVVCLRNAYEKGSRFGCSITPRKKNLAQTKAFLAESAKKPLGPSAAARRRWLDQLRSEMGRQDIDVYGIDPRTRAARVLVEADYRMKLVGMGLEDGTLGVKSYLDRVTLGKDGKPKPMNVLRWWFTLNYKSLSTTAGRDAFQLDGQGAKVLSENELITEIGERVHTGTADEHTSEFAHSFTKHFDKLSAKYPVYAELKNIFDLALLTAVIKAEDLPGQVGWHMTHFGTPISENDFAYEVELGIAPREVETVINHRMIGRKHIVAGVSGGVSVDAKPLVSQDAIQIDQYGLMKAERITGVPKDLPHGAWWWD
jgi:hypothetical protein